MSSDDLKIYRDALIQHSGGDIKPLVDSFMQKVDESICKPTLIASLKHRVTYERISDFESKYIRQIIERLG